MSDASELQGPQASDPELRGALRISVVVEGPDATGLLDSQLSQSLKAMEVGGSCWSLVLEPDGHLGDWLRVVRSAAERWVLLGGSGREEALAERMARFRLRERAEISMEPCGVVVSAGVGFDGLGLPALWAVGQEREFLVAPAILDIAETRESELEAQRIELGRLSPDDLRAGDNPLCIGSANLKRSVSFTKGCYTGQELVARMDARSARAPRRMLLATTMGQIEAGEVLMSDGKEVGEVRTSVDGRAAWCMVARSVTAPSPVAVTCGSHEVTLVEPSGGV